jgi:hypothetical protein
MKLNFNSDSSKDKQELINLLYTERVKNSTLISQHDSLKLLVEEFIEHVEAHVKNIKESKGIFKLFAIKNAALEVINLIEMFISKYKRITK